MLLLQLLSKDPRLPNQHKIKPCYYSLGRQMAPHYNLQVGEYNEHLMLIHLILEKCFNYFICKCLFDFPKLKSGKVFYFMPASLHLFSSLKP